MGLIHIYTGEGGGKTTAALGVAVRMAGHGKKVIMVQFMKGRKNTGEWKAIKKISKKFEVRQFGRKGFVNLKNPAKEDRRLAQEGLKFAKEAMKRAPDLLVLDELNIACAYGLVDALDACEMLAHIPKKTVVYITGRHAPKEFVKCAAFVTEVRDLKRPDFAVPARKGIEY